MGVVRMKLVQKTLVLLIASWFGCLCSLILLEFLRTLSADKPYLVVLPVLFGTALAITGVPCALFARRVPENSQIMLIGLIEGLAVPWVCNLIWDLFYWDRPIARYQLYICALFACTVSFAGAYFVVNGNLGSAN